MRRRQILGQKSKDEESQKMGKENTNLIGYEAQPALRKKGAVFDVEKAEMPAASLKRAPRSKPGKGAGKSNLDKR